MSCSEDCQHVRNPALVLQSFYYCFFCLLFCLFLASWCREGENEEAAEALLDLPRTSKTCNLCNNNCNVRIDVMRHVEHHCCIKVSFEHSGKLVGRQLNELQGVIYGKGLLIVLAGCYQVMCMRWYTGTPLTNEWTICTIIAWVRDGASGDGRSVTCI